MTQLSHSPRLVELMTHPLERYESCTKNMKEMPRPHLFSGFVYNSNLKILAALLIVKVAEEAGKYKAFY